MFQYAFLVFAGLATVYYLTFVSHEYLTTSKNQKMIGTYMWENVVQPLLNLCLISVCSYIHT